MFNFIELFFNETLNPFDKKLTATILIFLYEHMFQFANLFLQIEKQNAPHQNGKSPANFVL